jgi:hypothetical protein
MDGEICGAKVDAILRRFQSQQSKHWFTESTFQGMAKIRGVECASGNAEAFCCRKMIF